MAYAALNSLMNTIERLLSSSYISLVPPSPEIIELAYQEVGPLQELLEELDKSSKSKSRKRVNSVDAQIREAVRKLEDALESHVSNQLLSRSECLDDEPHPWSFSIDLQGLDQYISSFTQRVMELKRAYRETLRNLLCEGEEEEDDDDADSLRTVFGGERSKMVGLSDQFQYIKHCLIHRMPLWEYFLHCGLVGMPGIGKTTLAIKIFEDPQIVEHFEFRGWVTVGRKCQLKEIHRAILAQVDPDMTDKMPTVGDEIIEQYIEESLKGKRYFIVLDDVWDREVCDHLGGFFKDNKNGSRVLVTSRLQNLFRPIRLGNSILYRRFREIKIRLLNKEESWDLLRKKVFEEDLCPPQLEKPGKKIAEKCEGLPLTINAVASLLSKAEKTPEYWTKVAEEKNSVFNDAYNEILGVLYPSYEYLSQHLKACFLYMGVFPQNSRIPRSNLFNRLIAEGFLANNTIKTSEDFAMKCLNDLVSNSLVMVYKNSTNSNFFRNYIKNCGVHSSLWHLSKRVSTKNKFYHILNSCADGLEKDMKSQRRLCIHNNVLFAIERVRNAIEDDCVFTARSLLCFGPYHQYQVPICFGLRLLGKLDALTIRFYEFPMEVLKLVQLRYLALTYNGKLPASIAKLWNLQFLIVLRHSSIKCCGAPSYVPDEIWEMHELKHIQIMGSNLPNPNCGISLHNLLTLSDVSTDSCTEDVLRRIPMLKKLGIRIELAHDVAETLVCLNHISCLDKLESLKCVVVDPEFRSRVIAPPAPHSMFPHSLQKLTLSGFGYPWEYMSLIDSLSNLEVLKLQCYAFRGPKWEIEDNRFRKLNFLLIEDTNLVQWKIGHGSLTQLSQLSIKYCYQLKEIDAEPFWRELLKIEMFDCNPLAVDQLSEKCRAHICDVRSSWDDMTANLTPQKCHSMGERIIPITISFSPGGF